MLPRHHPRQAAAPSSRRTATAVPTAGCATLTEADSPLVDRLRPSPNHGDRRGRTIDSLILHYTGMTTGEAALQRLRDPAAEVSAHYLVWEDGSLDQLVAEADRAWHAGRSFWQGERDLNAVSVGIEIVNGGHDGGLPPFPPVQIGRVVALVGDVCARRAIPPVRVLGHSDVAPDRKCDPGEHFPWHILATTGVAASPPPPMENKPGHRPAIGGLLATIGYACAPDDDSAADAVRAFQRRWRPRMVDGFADGETRALAAAMAASGSFRGVRCPPKGDSWTNSVG